MNDMTPADTSTALTLPAAANLAEMLKAENGLDGLLSQLEMQAHAEAKEADAATKKGRDALKSIAFRVSKSKVSLEDRAKELTEAQRKAIEAVNAGRNAAVKRLEALRDETEEDPAEVEASEYDLAYIKLDGTIGCMVNGAGLAMATMDIIKLNGAFPANFLDVGGGATTEKVTAAFKIILKDPAVEGILVNIFGGIMKCDVIANGIVQAAKDVNLQVPLVVRLEGTNVAEGKAILENSGLAIVSADNLGDAAQKIVAEVKKAA